MTIDCFHAVDWKEVAGCGHPSWLSPCPPPVHTHQHEDLSWMTLGQGGEGGVEEGGGEGRREEEEEGRKRRRGRVEER